MAFDFSVFKDALQKKQAFNEIKRKELLQKVINTLKEMAKRYGLSEAFVFGSIVKEKKFSEDSDLDVAVLGLKGELFLKFMAEISSIIGRDVDVIELERCRFAKRILKEGIRVE